MNSITRAEQAQRAISHVASYGPADRFNRCMRCGHAWRKDVWLWWPVRVRFSPRPGPARPVWTLSRWSIEETPSLDAPIFQRHYSTVVKIGPLILHFGMRERRVV